MLRIYQLISTIFFLMLCSSGKAQGSKLITKNIRVTDCTIIIDSVTVSPLSVNLKASNRLVKNGFHITNNKLILSDSLCKAIVPTEISISYRALSFDIEAPFLHLDSTTMKTVDQAIVIPSNYHLQSQNTKIIDAKGLDYNGSFSRGFSVGNAQSLVLNSNFNLQLAGDLGNGLNVVAAISDDNIPIQPEGNTQLIQEFDKVFVQISKGRTRIVAGDYVLERPKSYFINYLKKLKGLSSNSTFDIKKDKSLYTKGSFAIARGKFARQNLDTKEGNQGPYKLTGANGERFLIVLSGSEKVYLDGLLLERGFEYDYIIDYNRAEITFTSNRLIGRESRIIVEYEYRDQNYLRSVYAADVNIATPKVNMNFSFYNEQDSKNATGDIVLDSLDIQKLSSIGDQLNQARVNSFRRLTDTTFIPGQVRYRLNPNVIPGDTAPFFLEYSNDLTDVLYLASFNEVPQGTGRYNIDETTTINGRVYTYVGPDNGNYEPFTTLTPPEKKQIMSLRTQIKPRENIDIDTELSLSNNDVNRFAQIGNDDNIGTASMIHYTHRLELNKKKKKTLTAGVKHEYRHNNFIELNPYRSAEFSRDWNILSQKIKGEQNLIEGSLRYQLADSIKIGYSFNMFNVREDYRGINQIGNASFRHRGFKAIANYRFLESEGYGEKTSFYRPFVSIDKLVSEKYGLTINATYEAEQNKKKRIIDNTLQKSSFKFDSYRAALQNSEEQKWHFKFEIKQRKDFFPSANTLVEAIHTNIVNTTTKYQISKNHSLGFNAGFRDFDVRRKELIPNNSTSKKTLIGRFDHQLNAWNGLLITSTNYIINSGQEPKVEYFFEKVETGQGDYIYIGNADSTLVNANFRYAPNLGTGDYIRLSLINNEFISTNNQSLTHSMRWDPKKYFSTKTNDKKYKPKKLHHFLSRWSTISTVRIAKKVEADDASQANTFLNFSSDTPSLVSFNSLINNTLFFNRGNSLYDLQIGQRKTTNIFTQISGREERGLSEFFFRSRFKMGRKIDFILNTKKGKKSYASKTFADRNLHIDLYQIKPEISYRPFSDLRFNLIYSYDGRQQLILEKEQANSNDFTCAITYRQAESANINFSMSLVNVTFDGAKNSPIEFDMLEGLKDGKNYLWNILFTKRLTGNIDLNISYEGRKSELAPTIHIAKAQVKATF